MRVKEKWKKPKSEGNRREKPEEMTKEAISEMASVKKRVRGWEVSWKWTEIKRVTDDTYSTLTKGPLVKAYYRRPKPYVQKWLKVGKWEQWHLSFPLWEFYE